MMRIAWLFVALVLLVAPMMASATPTKPGGTDMFKSLLSKIGIGTQTHQAAGAPRETMADLREAVAERLRKESEIRDIRLDPNDPAVLTVTAASDGSEPMNNTINLTNVYGRLYILQNDADRAQAIENVVFMVLSSVRQPALDLGNVYANIRFVPPDAQGAEGTATFTDPFAGDVSIVYQIDTPQSLHTLSFSRIGNIPVETLRKAARENILREMPKLHLERAGDIIAYRIADNTPITPSIVLTDEFWAMVDKEFPGGAYMMLRLRDEVAVIDRNAPDATGQMRRLIDVARERGIDFLSDRIFERRDGSIVAVDG